MIKVTAYTNPEAVVVNALRDLSATTTEDGWKVVLQFRDEAEMKALQDALNRLYPENMRTIEEMPTEEGYYITQTGTLLYHDEDGDWSFRRPNIDCGKLTTEPIDHVWSDGLSSLYSSFWPDIVATLGSGAFPLVPVKFA